MITFSYGCFDTSCTANPHNATVTELNFTPSYFGFVKSVEQDRNGWVVNSPDNQIVRIAPNEDRRVQFDGSMTVKSSQ